MNVFHSRKLRKKTKNQNTGFNLPDFFYKLLRKNMPKFLYYGISGSYFGRQKFFTNIEYFQRVFSEYQKVSVTGFKDKTVLEIGCGDQLFTAFFFLMNGCNKVILTEPKFKIFNDNERFCLCLNLFRGVYPTFDMPDNEIRKRVSVEKDIRNIPNIFNDKTDFIFTHNVLEHFDDLNIFYCGVSRLLTPQDGTSYNIVDLSDHTYHIFSRFKFFEFLCYRNRLNHLRYSNKTFALINDPRSFMNRFLLPLYLQKAMEHGLECRITDKVLLDFNVPIHRDLVENLNVADKENLNVTGFRMFLKKSFH
jgi:SAM-dependent methyltransferase